MFTDFNLQLKYNQIHYWIVAILIGRKKSYSADAEISIQYYLIYGYLSVFFHYVFEKCQSAGEKKKPPVILPSRYEIFHFDFKRGSRYSAILLWSIL